MEFVMNAHRWGSLDQKKDFWDRKVLTKFRNFQLSYGLVGTILNSSFVFATFKLFSLLLTQSRGFLLNQFDIQTNLNVAINLLYIELSENMPKLTSFCILHLILDQMCEGIKTIKEWHFVHIYNKLMHDMAFELLLLVLSIHQLVEAEFLKGVNYGNRFIPEPWMNGMYVCWINGLLKYLLLGSLQKNYCKAWKSQNEGWMIKDKGWRLSSWLRGFAERQKDDQIDRQTE